jgi:hypothetical protein
MCGYGAEVFKHIQIQNLDGSYNDFQRVIKSVNLKRFSYGSTTVG